ncbi:Major facilitator superfamily multidrug-resistance DHA1 sub-family [Mycena venus]|uniref:Major facilitator superfamily multidrug-resistance DHA1 sub-family n=1 Tax=Mycena venus TaxID=2733690 RepID=A0A8H7CAI2_9AGAR|nr:Major facilitator superfamily multidrug-resistance DHA1 sub-family [Mycena venus]
MSPQDTDETTPLLAAQNDRNDLNDHLHSKRTPLPLFQFSIVLFLQLAEPLTSNVIYPFAPQLMRDIGVTHGDETKVGYYVGIMVHTSSPPSPTPAESTQQSIFFLTQAMTVLHWSRLSDHIGRKPVILIGLFGLSLSMYCFSLSRTFWGLVLSRSLNGALNGNIGVIKSIVAELTDSTNIAQAYAYMPIAWSTGSTLGPIIGGFLARPADRFEMFRNNQFLRKYPYFLPCAVPATFSLVAWTVTLLFLKETATGPSVISLPRLFRRKDDSDTIKRKREVVVEDGTSSPVPESEKAVPLRGALAIHPVFLATPIELGGLGLSTSSIGNLLSVFGVLNGISQVFFFARVHDYLGSKMTFILGIASALPLFAAFPLLSYLAQTQGLSTLVWAIAFGQIVLSLGLSFSYGAVFIYISAAAPNRASLGATNGLCQLSVSVMRAIGPAAANSLFSLSMEKGYMHGYMVFYVLAGVTGVALWVGAQLPRRPWGL